MENILIILSVLLGLSIYIFTAKRFLHVIQLEGYKNNQFSGWLSKNLISSFVYPAVIFALLFLSYFISNNIPWNKTFTVVVMAIAFILCSIAYFRSYSKKAYKKPLVFTHRMIRLTSINILVILLETTGVYFACPKIKAEYVLFWFSFALIISSLNLMIANLIAYPIEKMNHAYYINSAKAKINSMKDLIRIGITGSYGKTSTKFILSTILAEKFTVLFSPESYNTTMGTTKVIRDMLNDNHEILISEMGARNRGDIKELCDIVKPTMGIITSIGKQHLETFKTIENVAKTKYELIEGLQPEGKAFFPSDNDYCYELYKKTQNKKILYGIEKHLDEVDLKVENIELSEKGSSFELVCKNGSKAKCVTKLLGKHNVLNILGCAAIAKELGLTLEEIASGIAKIEPVPHRLQIIPSQNGTIVIDDAFNSNPVGAKMALEVISQFKGRKVIITPGMVELGKEEYELNKDFGRNMAEVLDYAILVGKKRTQAIQDGLLEKGFDNGKIFVVSSLEEATGKLASIVKAGDVVLFENDLPDNYDE